MSRIRSRQFWRVVGRIIVGVNQGGKPWSSLVPIPTIIVYSGQLVLVKIPCRLTTYPGIISVRGTSYLLNFALISRILLELHSSSPLGVLDNPPYL